MDSPLTVSLELFDIASNAARSAAIPVGRGPPFGPLLFPQGVLFQRYQPPDTFREYLDFSLRRSDDKGFRSTPPTIFNCSRLYFYLSPAEALAGHYIDILLRHIYYGPFSTGPYFSCSYGYRCLFRLGVGESP
ncbi:BQ5605_C028g10467 [Microbotryum silenes-dioicae]|uniref:BQ5605_C028g10467 protein n=1 Tax=Microbotryum silenes-dioicae TaxID=796604 RepID=A0A2X0PJJ2_9BASI|nr:BQ5605_C028g10467 [Microbotryum silenes-dioicae]